MTLQKPEEKVNSRTSYFLHLAALSSFALAQQYFDPLADGADVFIEEGATALDVVVFALLLLLLPPAVLFLLELVAGLASERLREALHLAFIAGFVSLIAWQALGGAGSALPANELFALAAGVAAAAAYRGFEPVRTYLTVLSVAPVVVLALFLVFSPVRTLVFGGDGHAPVAASTSGAPVVMLVFDELPTASLMDARQRIDAELFPSFARLARDASWYRGAVTVGDFTQIAVPSILTGRSVRPGELQTAGAHPENLFALLGGSYRLDVSEMITDLCGEACPLRERAPFAHRIRRLLATSVRELPGLPLGLRKRAADLFEPGNARPAPARPLGRSVRRHLRTTQDVRFERFLATLRPSRGRTLHYLHLLLPHRPWLYLPSGHKYRSLRPYQFEGVFSRWPRDPRALTQGYQRHLLQLGYVDRLLGRVLDRLRALGLYDRALVVVTADHGAAFRPGDHSRIVTSTNVAEIAHVPLFVKAPRQRAGRVDDGHVQTTDVVPTVAKLLRARMPWRVEGRPADEVGRSRRGALTIYREKGGGKVVASRVALERGRAAAVRRRLRLFGPGRRGLFRAGPHPELVGRRLSTLAATSGGLRATLDGAGRYLAVDPASNRVPADVSGVIEGGPPRSRPLAIAVNGRVAATVWSIAREGGETFTAVVAASAFRRGRNRVTVLAIEERAGSVRLRPLSG